ncbi:ParB/RepB/Spo0J family partition protein [Kaistia sp. MMO-174]|uniref:ParB/RepB/Spo0J family partition protein n=1 Tax=Kaistia sp. MMO-174 TaxID=3081256 RepID=UPI003015EB49
MGSVVDLPIALIYPPIEARGLDQAKVQAIAQSIQEVGLINPIIVKKALKVRHGAKAEAWEVVAGNHRYEACAVVLKMETVKCVVSDADDLVNELIMIDENLCRAELSPSDRARFTARRKEIYEIQHPGTAHGGDRRSSRQIGDLNDTQRFTENTANATGRPERSIQRDAERGEKVIDEALDLIRGTALDTGTYLDKIKKLSPNDQVAAVNRDLLLARRNERAAKSNAALKLADTPLNDFEAKEKQVAALMSAWNRASPEAREEFMGRIDAPLMDRRYA